MYLMIAAHLLSCVSSPDPHAHSGAHSPGAAAQEPELYAELPNGDLGIRLKISSFLQDSGGAPWTTDVKVTVESPYAGFTTSVDATPKPTGEILCYTYLPVDFAFAQWDLRIWADPTAPETWGTSGPFLSPTAGTAALHLHTPTGDSQQGAKAALALSVLAPPPSVGTIQLTAAASPGLQLAIVDGEPGRWSQVGEQHEPWTCPVSTGTQSIVFYSWSHVGFWDFAFKNAKGMYMVVGSVRRGAAPHSVTIPPEVRVRTTVSVANHPLARHVILVDPTNHQPDPASPSGSSVSFGEQMERCEAASKLDLQPGGQVADALMVAFHAGGIVELWGKDTSQVPTRYFLISSHQLPAHAGEHVVSF